MRCCEAGGSGHDAGVAGRCTEAGDGARSGAYRAAGCGALLENCRRLGADRSIEDENFTS